MVLYSFYFYMFKIKLKDDKKMYCLLSWVFEFDEKGLV